MNEPHQFDQLSPAAINAAESAGIKIDEQIFKELEEKAAEDLLQEKTRENFLTGAYLTEKTKIGDLLLEPYAAGWKALLWSLMDHFKGVKGYDAWLLIYILTHTKTILSEKDDIETLKNSVLSFMNSFPPEALKDGCELANKILDQAEMTDIKTKSPFKKLASPDEKKTSSQVG